MIKVSAKAPTRIDLAGGTLDLWPLQHLLDHKMTVNVAVTLNANVEVCESIDGKFHLISQDQNSSFTGNFQEACSTRELPLLGLLVKALWNEKLPPLTITTSAKSPAGAGLGGSSCLGITIGGALSRAKKIADGTPELNEAKLIQTVQDVEAKLIHAPTGCQDYWGALRGGINLISFPFGGTEVKTLSPTALPGLSDELILCYTGKSRDSAINNWEIFKRIFDGDKNLLSIFNDIGSISEQLGLAIEEGDLNKVVHLSQSEWALRLKLWPNIVTSETINLDDAARAAGARFSRVCGAGGGGVMAMFAPKEKYDHVCQALNHAGGIVLKAGVSETGLQVES
jgi:D-glycero-alpha-D-manno-heptose-7-phosphate kinase